MYKLLTLLTLSAVLIPGDISSTDLPIVTNRVVYTLPQDQSILEEVPTPTPTPAFAYKVEQKSFLEVKAAKLYQSEKSTIIEIAEDDVPVVRKGAALTLDGVTETEIEVTTLLDFNGVTVGVFPPSYMSPVEGSTYHLLGKPGDRFGVRVRTATGLKTILVELSGTKPPPVDPPPVTPPTDLAQLTKLVSISVSTLNDTITQSAIKAELAKLLLAFPATLDAGKASTKAAISEGLLVSMPKAKPPYKDWNGGFRVPIDAELAKHSITTTTQLKQVVQAIHDGM